MLLRVHAQAEYWDICVAVTRVERERQRQVGRGQAAVMILILA